MNNKGQTVLIAVFFAFFLYLFGIVFINFIIPDVDTARSALSCSDTTISDGSRLLCLFVTTPVVYFIMALLSIVGGIIIERLAV